MKARTSADIILTRLQMRKSDIQGIIAQLQADIKTWREEERLLDLEIAYATYELYVLPVLGNRRKEDIGGVPCGHGTHTCWNSTIKGCAFQPNRRRYTNIRRTA